MKLEEYLEILRRKYEAYFDIYPDYSILGRRLDLYARSHVRSEKFFLTKKSDIWNRVRSFRLGAKDFIVKPIHVMEIIARVGMVLSRLEKRNEEEAVVKKKFVGRLEDFSIADLIETFGVERKTGVLTVSNENGLNGQLFFLHQWRKTGSTWPCSEWGCQTFDITAKPVGSYPTISPLPPENAGSAVYFLLQYPSRHRELRVTKHPALRSSDFPPHPATASFDSAQDDLHCGFLQNTKVER